jgi:hypothetical protein
LIFEFFHRRLPGPFYNLELIGTFLKCTQTHEHISEQREKIIVIEGNPEWQEVLNFLSTRKWKKEYFNESVDGTQWELRVSGTISILTHMDQTPIHLVLRKFLRLLNDVVVRVVY